MELPGIYHVREITSKDFNKPDTISFPIKQLYEQLSSITIDKEKAEELFKALCNNPDRVYIGLFYMHNLKVTLVGLTTLYIERKVIHNGQCVGHIEDVVIDQGHRGKKLGSSLINKAVSTAKTHNCYKIILACKKELEQYYTDMLVSHGDIKSQSSLSLYF